jgi:hypothetical protein
VDVDHVGIDNQVADILTKPLGKMKSMEVRSKLGVVCVQ